MPDLNKETRANLQLVRDAIAAMEAKQFNMSQWGSPCELREHVEHKCGSAGCIGGWTEALLFDTKGWPQYVSEYEVGAKLGLDQDETDNLFFMIHPSTDPYDTPMHSVTQIYAVKMLDHILCGGEIDWDLVVLGRPIGNGEEW